MTKPCKVCGVHFDTFPSRKRKFCSRACYIVAHTETARALIAQGLRRCSHCHEVRSETSFYNSGKIVASTGDTRVRWCNVCRCENERLRRIDVSHVENFHARYETDMDFRARELLRGTQKRCRRHRLAYDLDIPWLAAKLRAGRCELTGLAFDFSVRARRPQVLTPSIDRIRPELGYTKANCRLVVFAVNVWLKDFTLAQLLPVAAALVDKHSEEDVA